MSPSPPPFSALPVTLKAAAGASERIALAALSSVDAGILGAGLAAIDPWRRLGLKAGLLAAFLAAPGGDATARAITAGEALAGVIVVRHPWLMGPYLNVLAVLPPFQGRGIGGAALGWFIAEGRRIGARNLWLCTSGFNGDARRFYARHGFAEAAVLRDVVKDGEDEVLMRRRG